MARSLMYIRSQAQCNGLPHRRRALLRLSMSICNNRRLYRLLLTLRSNHLRLLYCIYISHRPISRRINRHLLYLRLIRYSINKYRHLLRHNHRRNSFYSLAILLYHHNYNRITNSLKQLLSTLYHRNSRAIRRRSICRYRRHHPRKLS